MENSNESPKMTPVMGSAKTMPGVMELISQSKEIVMKRASLFFIIVALPAVLTFIGQLVFVYSPLLAIVSMILMIAGWVVGIFSAIALIKSLSDESIKDWKEAYGKAKGLFWQFIWAAILVAIVISIGFILLIIPGIYLAVAFGFYLFALVLDGARGWDTAKKSKELVKGYWWAVFGRWLAFGIIIGLIAMVIGGVVAAIGSQLIMLVTNALIGIVLTPFAVAYSYLMYKSLKELKKDAPKASKPEAEPKPASA